MNEGHFKDLLFELIPPPAQRATSRAAGAGASNPAADLMMMGFPTRLPETSAPALCVCHSLLKSEGFVCPRCAAKVCDVPTDCDICGLMIVSSPHLARSYHHLFPVKPYQAVYVVSYLFIMIISCASRPSFARAHLLLIKFRAVYTLCPYSLLKFSGRRPIAQQPQMSAMDARYCSARPR